MYCKICTLQFQLLPARISEKVLATSCTRTAAPAGCCTGTGSCRVPQTGSGRSSAGTHLSCVVVSESDSEKYFVKLSSTWMVSTTTTHLEQLQNSRISIQFTSKIQRSEFKLLSAIIMKETYMLWVPHVRPLRMTLCVNQKYLYLSRFGMVNLTRNSIGRMAHL